MNFNLQITGDSAAELVQTLQAFASATTVKAAEPVKELTVTTDPAVQYTAPATRTRSKATPKEEVKEQPKEEPQAEVEEATATNAPAVTVEEVRALVHSKATAGFRAEVKALLQAFGVERVTDLTEAMYAKFYERLTAL